MRNFFEREQYKGYNIYSMKKYVDKKRRIFTITVITILVITLLLISYYTIDSIYRLKKARRFQEQVVAHQEQLEKEQAEKERIRQERLPKLTEIGKENIKNIYHAGENKQAFLTFDDGPSVHTEQILTILREEEIKASFFVLGTYAEKMPETIKKIYNEGHYIANHGYSHIYKDIYAAPENVLTEYDQCNEAVQKILGEGEYNSHLFRFPGGLIGGKYANIKKEAKEILEQNEIMQVDWNALTGDSEKPNVDAEYIMNNLQMTTQNKNSVVLLMHDSETKGITAETLPQVIEFLRNQGYEFKSFYDILK